jgi:ABC-type transport system substrate-binding protein
MSKNVSSSNAVLVALLIISIIVSGVSAYYSNSLIAISSSTNTKIDALTTKLGELTSAELSLSNAVKDLATAQGKTAADIVAIQEKIKSLNQTVTPTKKNVIRIGIINCFETMDPPQWGDDTLNALGQNVWEALFRMAWDGTQAIYEPVLCSSYELTDNLIWVFHIRQGVKFSDGSPLTAQDVYWSLSRNDPRPPNMMWSLDERIQSYEIVDDYTIKMVTKYPMSNLQAWLCQGWTNIVSYEWVKKTNQLHKEVFDGISPGTGPYMVTGFEPQVSAKMTLNPYWRKAAPQITDIEIYSVKDDTARVTALQTGFLDWIVQVPSEAISSLRDKGYTLWDYNLPQLVSIAPNNVMPPCDNIKVRQAMAYAINYDELLHTLYGETAVRPLSMALPGTIGYKEFPMYDYNPAKARQLLAEAGFANGITLKMAVVEGWALGKTLEATAALQNYFKDVGITLQVDVLERAAYRAMIAGERESYLAGQMPEFKWHIHFRPWGSDTLFAGDDMQSLYTSTTNINDWYYSNPKVDELILYSVSQAPLADRIKAIEQAQQIMMEDCAGIPLYTGVTFAASSSHLKGFIFQPNGYQYFVESTLIK